MSVESDLNKIFDLFSKSKLFPDVCTVFDGDNVKDIEVKKKTSASDSEVLFATFVKLSAKKNANVAMKVWISLDQLSQREMDTFHRNKYKIADTDFVASISDTLNYLDLLRGLTYEAKLYKFITENIISQNLSPNFIPFLAFGSCNLERLQEKMTKLLDPDDFQRLSKKIFKPIQVFKNLKLNILITGTKVGAMASLQDLLKEDSITSHVSPSDRAAIIFQCLYSLLLLEHFKIGHNDLHMNNILVQKLDKPTCLKFKIGDKSVAFLTNYEPKFYDWDRGFLESLGTNPALNEIFSVESHSKNTFSQNRDYYQFVCSLTSYPKFYELLSPLLPHPDYSDWKYGDDSASEKYLKLSSKSLKGLNGYLQQHPECIEKTIPAYGTYINIPTSQLDKIFTSSEISKIASAQRLTYSKTVFLRMNLLRDRVYVLPGWNCQPLFDPSDDLLHPLESIFTRDDLWNTLTSPLEKCSRPTKSNTFVFPSA